MANAIAARGSQNVQCLEFSFDFDSTMKDVTGAVKDFGKTLVGAATFDVAALPAGAVVVGGDLITDTAFTATTYKVSLGDAQNPARYLNQVEARNPIRNALVPTGFRSPGNLRLTVNSAAANTTGRATLRVLFVTPGRINEVYTP